jgi:hypothetical protein
MQEQLNRNIERQDDRLELSDEEVEARFQDIIGLIDQSVAFDDQERLRRKPFGRKYLGPKDSGNNFGHD